jgi:hypothetical protein
VDLRQPCQKFDPEEYRNSIITALAEENTVVYLDTNILAIPYKLFAGARDDFYRWVEANEKKVRIPNWVMNEYLKRATDYKKLNEFYPVKVDEISKQIKNQRDCFSILLDEDKAKKANFASVNEIIGSLDNAFSLFEDLNKRFRSNPEINTIRDEINVHLSKLTIEQKVSITSDLVSEFNIRLENEIPPGFDEDKKKNIIGDFIIWKEILADVKSKDIKKAIFLTNDGKKDWVYKPEKVIIGGRDISNNESKEPYDISLPVKLPDPRLVNEYYFATGTSNFYICDFYFFCNVLSAQSPGEYRNLELINHQIEKEKSTSSSDNSLAENEEKSSDCPQQPQPQAHGNDRFAALGVTESALKDTLKYQSSIPDVDEILEGFKTYNWYRQSRAIAKLFTVDKSSLSSDDLFLIGRNLYQTACGGEWETIRLLDSAKQFTDLFNSPEKTEKVILGILFEVYFDKEGIQRDVKKTGKIQTLFEYRNMYSEAFKKMGDILKKGNKKLFYFPGDTENIKIDVSGTLKRPEGYIIDVFMIDAIKINGWNILAQVDGDSYLWQHHSYYDLFKSFSSQKEMKAVIADIFALPLTLITLNMPDYKSGALQIEKRLIISEPV